MRMAKRPFSSPVPPVSSVKTEWPALPKKRIALGNSQPKESKKKEELCMCVVRESRGTRAFVSMQHTSCTVLKILFLFCNNKNIIIVCALG